MENSYAPGTRFKPNLVEVSSDNSPSEIDWNTVIKSGITSVAINLGGGMIPDFLAPAHFKMAKDAGILTHGYYVYKGQSSEANDAIQNAKLNGLDEGSGLLMRLEDPALAGDWTEQALSFCLTVKAAGFFPGIYTTNELFSAKFDADKLKEADVYVWLSDYSKRPQNGHDAWNFTDKFVLPGYGTKAVNASVDFVGRLSGSVPQPDPVPPDSPYKPAERPKIQPGAFVVQKKTIGYSSDGNKEVSAITPDGVHLQPYDLPDIANNIVFSTVQLVSPNGTVFLLSINDFGKVIVQSTNN